MPGRRLPVSPSGALDSETENAYCLAVPPTPTQAPRPLARPGDAPTRIKAALAACIARHGVTKTTLDDVAREAGCSRATLYRHFAGKRQLVEALVADEWSALVGALAAEVEAAETLEDALVALVTGGARALQEHEALQRVLELEPELALPYLTFDGAEGTFAVVAADLGPALRRFLPDDRAHRTAEWMARIVLSSFDAGGCAVVDEPFTRELVHDFVVPGVADPRG